MSGTGTTPGRKGYLDGWNPRGKTLELIGQVNEVLDEYEEHLPLTLRQVFYALVARHGYEKTEAGYKRLSAVLTNARRARVVSMGALRDDGGSVSYAGGYLDKSEFVRSLKDRARYYYLDRRLGQTVAVFAVCEAAGMGPMLRDVCRPYGARVLASGGFGSLTTKHAFAGEVGDELEEGRDVAVLTLGDLDPSGLSIMEDFEADVRAFLGDPPGLAFQRVMLTQEQAESWRLESAPPKKTDSRSKAWGDAPTYQLEAVPPGVLSRTLSDAVLGHVDLEALEGVMRRERGERKELERMLSRLDEGGRIRG
jgi:hypothetical protein